MAFGDFPAECYLKVFDPCDRPASTSNWTPHSVGSKSDSSSCRWDCQPFWRTQRQYRQLKRMDIAPHSQIIAGGLHGKLKHHKATTKQRRGRKQPSVKNDERARAKTGQENRSVFSE